MKEVTGGEFRLEDILRGLLMKAFFFSVVLSLFLSSVASANCRPQDWVLKDFTRAPGILGLCNQPIYHSNGRAAFLPSTGNWYHSNGAVAFWNASGNWYHPNGKAAYWATTGNWFHQNTEVAYVATTGNWFHPNRQAAYLAANGFWYHFNNVIAYNAQTGNWFYNNGTFAGSSDKAVPSQAVEFLLNQSCQVSSSVLCMVARFHE